MSAEVLLADLSHHGLIKVYGEDAESFLQNQLTNDVRNVSEKDVAETSHQTTAWCSPKGRIIATFTLFKRDDAYFLSLSQDLLEYVMKKLSMYVMMSKVTIEDATQSLTHFGISGSAKGIEDALQDSSKNLTVLKIAGTVPRFEVFGEVSDTKALQDNISPAPENYWDYLNILAGLPTISQASSEAWIPQMVNFIAVDGVDFKKGCYPGQEVVARLNYLGKTKRRMYHVQINTDTLPDIGASIASDEDQDAGKILNAVINPVGTVEALVVMKIAEAENTLTFGENKVSVLELPYLVDDA